MTEPQPQANPDDRSGSGWRSLTTGEVTQDSQMLQNGEDWVAIHDSETLTIFRRHTEPPQPTPDHPSDSEATPDHDRKGERQVNNEQTRQIRLLERAADALEALQHLLGAALKSNEGLEQELKGALRSKAELERTVQRYQNQLTGAQEQVERLSRELLAERDRCAKSLTQKYDAGCDAAISTIEKWLSPVVGLMAEAPEDCGPLATVLLGYLPQIADRMIQEKRQ